VPPAVAQASITCNSKDAVILSPVNDSVVAGTVDVSGIATASNFGSYKLELIGLGTGSKYLTVLDGSQPVVSASSLGQINLAAFPPGNYGLRLSVFNAEQQVQGRCLVNIALATAATVSNAEVSANTAITVIPVDSFPIDAVVTTESLTYSKPEANGAIGVRLTVGAVVHVDMQAQFGKWSHVVLEGGKNGWVLSSALRFAMINAQAGATSEEKRTVIWLSPLREKPNDNANLIRMVERDTVVRVNNTSVDGYWKHVILPDGSQGWLGSGAIQIEGVLQVAAPSVICSGTIGSQPAPVSSRPVFSSTGVILNMLKSGTHVTIVDVDNQSGNQVWYYVQSFDDSAMQGWVPAAYFTDVNNCPQPATENQFTVVVPTPIPTNFAQSATVVPTPVEPAVSLNSAAMCNSAITVEGTTLHVTNQVDKAASIYAAPLTINSNAAVVGELAAKSEAMLLYQQYDQQSAPVGALWYLIMTNGEGDKQVTGWVSANSITAVDGCSTTGGGGNAAVAAVSPDQIGAITGVAATGSTQTGTCYILNATDHAATVFAAPLTADSNAPVVGTFPAQSSAVVIFQNYDQQSDPTGALWYLITTNGVNDSPITGWISANSINATDSCAPEQLTGVTLETAETANGTISAMPVPNVATSGQSGSCTVTNSSMQTVTMYTLPLPADRNAAVAGEFLAGMDAKVVGQYYDRQSDPNGVLWYMITTSGDKSVTGWVSADTVNAWAICAPEIANADVVTEAVPQGQAGGSTGASIPETAPLGICHVVNPQRDSVPVFSGPSSKGDETTLVNNLTPNVSATVLYQQVNKETRAVWYLVIAVMEQGKQISGWVSADGVKVVDRCPVVS
jgi:hypothetical protein